MQHTRTHNHMIMELCKYANTLFDQAILWCWYWLVNFPHSVNLSVPWMAWFHAQYFTFDYSIRYGQYHEYVMGVGGIHSFCLKETLTIYSHLYIAWHMKHPQLCQCSDNETVVIPHDKRIKVITVTSLHFLSVFIKTVSSWGDPMWLTGC